MHLKKDIAEKSLLEQDDVFADIANVNLFNGAQTILRLYIWQTSLKV